jgi:protoheme IX farnesyltransferase
MLIAHLRLAKIPLCLLVAGSGLFGFFLAAGGVDWRVVPICGGIFMLAAGAVSLNGLQEIHVDTLLRRTSGRPLASGVMSRTAGLRQSQFLLAGGFLLFLVSFPTLGPAVAGCIAVIVYNGVYTPLKYRTIWAIIPGALCGAIPPYIGWLAAGGEPVSALIGAATMLLALWQIPHFLLIMLKHKADYRSSVLPSFIDCAPDSSLRLLIVVWTSACVAVVHVILMQLIGSATSLWWLISLTSLIFLAGFSVRLYKGNPPYDLLFIVFNCFMAIMLLLLSLAALMAPPGI